MFASERPNAVFSKSINSFTMSPSISQVLSYILISAQIAVYFTCLFSELPTQPSRIAWTIAYCLLFCILVVSTFLTSYIDPTDPIVRRYKTNILERANFNRNDYYYCSYCDSYCSSDSKHCRECNRCVEHFDHHCMWINNCIGKSNYSHFMVMIVSALLLMIVFVAATVQCTIGKSAGPEFRPEAKMVVVWVMLAVSVVFGALLVYLVGLHFYLISQGLTTFEHSRGITLAGNRKNREEAAKKQEPVHKGDSNNVNAPPQLVSETSPGVFEMSNTHLKKPESPKKQHIKPTDIQNIQV